MSAVASATAARPAAVAHRAAGEANMNTRHHVSIALFAPPALLGAILPAAALDGAPHAELPSWMAGQWLDPAGQTLWREFWEAVFAGTWSVPFTLLLIGIGLLALCATGMVLFLLASLIVTIAVALGLLPAKRQPHDKGPRR